MTTGTASASERSFHTGAGGSSGFTARATSSRALTLPAVLARRPFSSLCEKRGAGRRPIVRLANPSPKPTISNGLNEWPLTAMMKLHRNGCDGRMRRAGGAPARPEWGSRYAASARYFFKFSTVMVRS